MKIAYGKLGRSIPLHLGHASSVGGDAEVVRLLDMLRGEHEVHLIGRNRADRDLENVVNYWRPGGPFDDIPPASRHRNEAFDRYDLHLEAVWQDMPRFDAVVLWLGQHGSSLHPVPAVQAGKIGTFTNPMVSDLNYAYPIIKFVNQLNVRPIWLCPDPRNMVKFRDLWNPKQRSILAQYNTHKANTFYDERDGTLRNGATRYMYAGIELLAVPQEIDALYTDRGTFGVLVNEGYSNLGGRGRCALIKHWLKDLDYEIHGHWCVESQRELGRTITPVPLRDVLKTLGRWHATMTFPATNSGWATAKPWECFSVGTICFAHPKYDDQDHIYSRAFMPDELRTFLRVSSPLALKERLNAIRDPHVWRHYAELQWHYLQDSRKRLENGFSVLRETIASVALDTRQEAMSEDASPY